MPLSNPDQPITPLRAVVIALAALILFVAVQLITAVISVQLLIRAGVVDRGILEQDATRVASFDMVQVVLLSEIMMGCAFAAVAAVTGVLRTLLDPTDTVWALLRLFPLLGIVVGTQVIGSAVTHDPFLAPHITLGRALTLCATAIAIGIAEELVFRGLMVHGLQRAQMPVLTVTVSAVLFGALHLFDNVVNAVAVTLALAVPFALVRLRGGSLGALIVVHSVIDIAALLSLGNLDLPDSTPPNEAVTQIVMASIICAAYVLWYRRDVRLVEEQDAMV